jgi:tryptophanyl-tRNA synthetase
MSKTYGNCIYLSDSRREVEQKIRTMTTDPQRIKRTDKGDPELSPVFQLHKIFSSKEEQDDVAAGCRTAGIGCIDCKKVLIKNLMTVLEPIWERRSELMNNPDKLEDIISAGSQKAGEAASITMGQVRKSIGLFNLM